VRIARGGCPTGIVPTVLAGRVPGGVTPLSRALPGIIGPECRNPGKQAFSTRRKNEDPRGPRRRKAGRFARSAFKPDGIRTISAKAKRRFRCGWSLPQYSIANCPSYLCGPLGSSFFLCVEKRFGDTVRPGSLPPMRLCPTAIFSRRPSILMRMGRIPAISLPTGRAWITTARPICTRITRPGCERCNRHGQSSCLRVFVLNHYIEPNEPTPGRTAPRHTPVPPSLAPSSPRHRNTTSCAPIPVGTKRRSPC
jgi:hypothetical protein